MAHTTRNPYPKHRTHNSSGASDMGFVIRKMPPRQKIVNDIRERECKDQVRNVGKGDVARLDISKTYF